MDLSSKRNIKNLLKKYRIRPSKRLGQNFLVDKSAARRVVLAANLSLEDIVLEIGPGIGALTQEMAKKAKEVVAVEKDQKMCQTLKELLKVLMIENVAIANEDILKIEAKNYKLKPKNYKIIGNLPFYLTAAVIRKFLEDKVPPKEMALVVQKEVGQRICAKPPDMNLLAVSVQVYASPKIISYISKKSFWPQSKVDSAIIKITVDKRQLAINRGLFFKIVKAGFSQPRKQLLNNLSNGLKLNKELVKSWLLKSGVQPTKRAETLDIENWIKLTKSYLK